MRFQGYPRAVSFEPFHPGRGGRCIGCRSTTADVGKVPIQVSRFRGDDVVIKCCRSCFINIDVKVLLDRAVSPGLALALDAVVAELGAVTAKLTKLRAAALVVTTDIAQDILEDPCGSSDREKAGFHRVAVAAVARLNEALEATP